MPFNHSVHPIDVDVCRPETCPGCDPQEDCVLALVTNKMTATGPPFLHINKHGGDLDRWQTGITLTNWATAGEEPTSVLCLGDFIMVTSNAASAVYYTDDLGVTLVENVEASWTAGPNSSDAIDQSFIVMVHDSGHISGSYDAARTWEWLEDGNVTDVTLNRVMIARDNPQVIFAIGARNTVEKSENGGQNWFTLSGPGAAADSLTAIWVKDQFHVLVMNDDADVFETSDGGETWEQQEVLPNLLGSGVVGRDMMGCGCDGVWAIVGHSGAYGTITYHRIYRNVDGGASGRWFVPENVQTPTREPRGIACCDINRAIVVGGIGITGSVTLIA